MAGLGHNYAPAAGAIGPAAYGAGLGTFQQRQSERGDARKLAEAQFKMNTQSTLLGAGLQNRQQQASQAAQQQQMWLGAQLQGQQQLFQQQLQQQELADNLAYRQQMGEMQIGLQRELGFQELDQQTQIQALRNRPEASAAYQQLKAREMLLNEALDEGRLTQPMHAQMMQRHLQEIAGFDPSQFPYQGQFEPGKEIGDSWQAPIVLPDGSEGTGWWTRDRSGTPVLRRDTEMEQEARWKAWTESQKPAGQKGAATTDNIQADNVRADQAIRYKRIEDTRKQLMTDKVNAMPEGATTLPTVTDQEVAARLIADEALHDSIWGGSQRQVGAGRSVPPLQVPVGMQGIMGDELNRPQPQQGAFNVPTPQQMPIPPLPPPEQIVPNMDVNPDNMAAVSNYLKQSGYATLRDAMASKDPEIAQFGTWVASIIQRTQK